MNARFRRLSHWLLQLVCLAVICPFARADTEYYKHVLFDNSLESDAYYYSSGKASFPSTIELIHGKLPVSHDVFYTPPNALRLKWRSGPVGGWEAEIRAINFRNRELNFHGDTLFFWCFSREGIPAGDLPLIQDFGHWAEFLESSCVGKLCWRLGAREMGSSAYSFDGVRDCLHSRIGAPSGGQGCLHSECE